METQRELRCWRALVAEGGRRRPTDNYFEKRPDEPRLYSEAAR